MVYTFICDLCEQQIEVTTVGRCRAGEGESELTLDEIRDQYRKS